MGVAKEKLLQVEFSHADIMEQLSSIGRSQEDEDSVRLIEEKEREIEMLREQVYYTFIYICVIFVPPLYYVRCILSLSQAFFLKTI